MTPQVKQRDCSPVRLIEESDEEWNVQDECINLQAAGPACDFNPSTLSTVYYSPPA